MLYLSSSDKDILVLSPNKNMLFPYIIIYMDNFKFTDTYKKYVILLIYSIE